MPSHWLSSWRGYLLSFIFGAISVVAFAPFELFPIIYLALAVLYFITEKVTLGSVFKHGFVFGLGLYLFGVSWVYVSLSTYGGMPLWMGSVAVLGFASIMALFVAFAVYTAKWLSQRSIFPFSILLPLSWVVFEWCKSWVFTGFPWMDIGYTQTPTWLMGWSAIGGVYLVSFMVIVLAICVAEIARAKSVVSLMVASVVVLAAFSVNKISWTEADGLPIEIGVVQANVPIEEKWLAESQQRTLAQYRDQTYLLNQKKALDLVVWPETALPYYSNQLDDNFWRAMLPESTAVLTGLMDHDEEFSYNAAVLKCSRNKDSLPQLYRKRHLVPFGEYQPLKFVFGWVYEYLNLPMSDFTPWEGEQALECGERFNLGLSICYEDSFSNEYREFTGAANILINISEDAWFGDSFAPHQRTQFAQMRARELGRPLVRAANSGPSLFVNHLGEVEQDTEQFVVAAVSRKVQAMRGNTPFMLFGSWVVWLSIVMLLASLLLTRELSEDGQ